VKLEVTELERDGLCLSRQGLDPDGKIEDPPPLFIDTAHKLLGKKLADAYARERAGEKIEVVVVPNPVPRAQPKMSESMRKRLIAEGKLKE